MDHKYYENERHLIYLNAYNMPEGMRCTGRFERDIDTERQRSTQMDNVNGVGSNKRELIQVGNDWRNIYTFRTGYLNKQEREMLDEMFVVNMVWEWRNNKYYSLDFVEDSKKFVDSGALLDSLEFKMTDAVKKKIIPQETSFT